MVPTEGKLKLQLLNWKTFQYGNFFGPLYFCFHRFYCKRLCLFNTAVKHIKSESQMTREGFHFRHVSVLEVIIVWYSIHREQGFLRLR